MYPDSSRLWNGKDWTWEKDAFYESKKSCFFRVFPVRLQTGTEQEIDCSPYNKNNIRKLPFPCVFSGFIWEMSVNIGNGGNRSENSTGAADSRSSWNSGDWDNSCCYSAGRSGIHGCRSRSCVSCAFQNSSGCRNSSDERSQIRGFRDWTRGKIDGRRRCDPKNYAGRHGSSPGPSSVWPIG